ncbi:MAG: hypothetical protein IAF38_02080, partial [Bacteroidia bacterium]|nr:hypothetical protein [Bacteroidia bacterium]
NRYFLAGDTTNGKMFYEGIDWKKALNPQLQLSNDERSESYKMLFKSLAINFALASNFPETFKLIKGLKEGYFRRNLLIDIVGELQEKEKEENCFMFLDSLYKEIDFKPKYGLKLIRLNARFGTQSMFDISLKLIKDAPDKKKPRALQNFIRGVAMNGYYYKAFNYVPDYVSSSNELELYTEILKVEAHNISVNKVKSVKNFIDPYSNYESSAAFEGSLWTSGDMEDAEGGNIFVRLGLEEE